MELCLDLDSTQTHQHGMHARRPQWSPNRLIPSGVALVVLGTLSPLHLVAAQEDLDPPEDEVQQRISALERQIEEMQAGHAEEIAALRREIALLREEPPSGTGGEEDELAALRALAAEEAQAEVVGDSGVEETELTARGLGLQALNPEISVTGDMYATFRDQEGNRERTDFRVRGLGIHLESYLDPYSRFKAAFPISESGTTLGEAYYTRYGLPTGMSATLGKFRQQFGVVNRWHKHALDQFDFPLPLRQIFGEGGLNQTGMSLDWALPPLWSTSQGLTFQVTGGQDPRLFTGNTLGTPSLLLHYKNYQDLSKDTYLELGLSGLVGWRDEWQVDQGGTPTSVYDRQATFVYGADCNVLWEPTDRMRYRNVEWRSELYFMNRRILAPDDSGRDTIDAWGAYSYLQTKVSRTVDVGVRLDYYEPDQKGYAALDPGLAPHAYPINVEQWQVGPYLTWSQSPWVRWRIEYNHLDPGDLDQPSDVLYLQLIFAAGPHKHERY